MSRRTLLPLILLVLAASPAAAGDVLFLDASDALPEAQRIRAVFEATDPAKRPGAWGYVHVRLHNPDAKQEHAIEVSIATDASPQSARFRASAVVAPGGAADIHLPLPTGTSWFNAYASADGGPRQNAFIHVGGGAEIAVLGIYDRGGEPRGSAFESMLSAAQPNTRLQWRASSTLPTTFALLTGFDLIVVPRDASRLPEALQRALVLYVAAGGRLALGEAVPSLPEALAPLETSLAPRPTTELHGGLREGNHGLGAWVASPLVLPDAGAFLGWWQRQVPTSGQARRVSGLPANFGLPLDIPGLGRVPVLAFFLLLLLFAIVAGPVSYTLLKRRRRLALLLVTIPALGFLFSGAILLYGFFSEGFGIIGATRSFTMLDQRSHDAVVAAGRTLFASLPVARLEPGADSFLGVERGDRWWDASSSRIEADLDRGFVLDGSALPSRTPTTFVTASVGRHRDRLRFKRLQDGTYEVLAGPTFAPRVAEGAVLLRTPEGGYFVSTASGRLQPLAASSAAAAIGEVVRPLEEAPLATDAQGLEAARIRERLRRRANPSGVPAVEPGAWVAGRVGRELPLGSYLARMAAFDALDDLGLDVEMRAAEHVVMGLLDAEDVLE